MVRTPPTPIAMKTSSWVLSEIEDLNDKYAVRCRMKVGIKYSWNHGNTYHWPSAGESEFLIHADFQHAPVQIKYSNPI